MRVTTTNLFCSVKWCQNQITNSPRRSITSIISSSTKSTSTTTTCSSSSSSFTWRLFYSTSPHSSARHGKWEFVVAESHQSKPQPQPPQQQQQQSSGHHYHPPSPPPLKSFSKNSPIAKWRDSTLKSLHSKSCHNISAGHDFYFVQNLADQSGLALGIADGVGSWEDENIDPAIFSQSLMYYGSLSARQRTADEESLVDLSSLPQDEIDADSESTKYTSTSCQNSSQKLLHADPVQIMDDAYSCVLKEPDVALGSSTACVVVLDSRSGKLQAANLGDSSFLIFRSGSLIHMQKPQTHYFNCPKQLTKTPFHDPSFILDLPKDSDVVSFNLRHGDIVMLATDGILDNVWPHELEFLVKKVMEDIDSVPDQDLMHKLAHLTVQYARACSFSTDKRSPFEAEAQKNHYNYPGGKVDDCTVVVALALEE